MAAPRTSLLARCAANSLDLAVRFWPENSRRWGQAVLAEMGEITEPAAAVNWAVGGILLFARALVAHFLEWMRLPAGAGLAGRGLPSDVDGPQFPKHSRLATAVILLAAATVLFLPMGREAARTVRASWRGFIPSQGDRKDLEKIAADAEMKKDARELAFVALSYPDADRATQFADSAVALDPSLVWIYACRYQLGGGLLENADMPKRLKSSDPDNAYVYLVSAYAVAEPVIERVNARHAGAIDAYPDALISTAGWVAEMDKAFQAPRYDSYFRRHEELAREGWNKNPNLSPGLIAHSLWARRVRNFLQLQTYTNLRVREALQANTLGNGKEAEITLGEITQLGRKMAAPSATEFERAVGNGLALRGLEGFRKLYNANGQAREEKEIEAQLREINAGENARVHSYVGWRSDVTRGFAGKAVGVQASAILTLFLGIAIACSLVLLEAGTVFCWKAAGAARWIACRVADHGPALFLCASVIFLISFRPLAEIYEQYRSVEQSNSETMGLFWQMFVLADANPLTYFYQPYHQWLVAAIALGMLAVSVVARALLRHRAVPKTPSC
jgi:hypothetical protein